MTAKPILYLGDTSLATAASYLAGVLTWAQLEFDYLPSDRPATETDLAGRKLVILSDYPAAMLTAERQQQLVAAVHDGTGLLMIGGWESFHGHGGDWDTSAVAEALPVSISESDDRTNCDQPALVCCRQIHPVVDQLPWDRRPPSIGGFNRFIPKRITELVLEVERQRVEYRAFRFVSDPRDRHPLLVMGHIGSGRTAALATDVAPHWVGGLVDWGPSRVSAQAPGAEPIEVGNLYAEFLEQLVAWTGQLEVCRVKS